MDGGAQDISTKTKIFVDLSIYVVAIL